MAVYAWLDNGSPQTVIAVTANQPVPGAGVDITNVTPQPAVGWTTPDGGVTWTAPSANSVVGNEANLLQKAQTALANNVAYLAIASPTQAQAISQVAALTRQIDALIKLATDTLSDTTGT